ncbi:MAG: HAMP domain-containing histidine kinase [Chloroflexota bacterium]|nr:HAMP domain-containing histidine kinase [Chloroflexota bacterium]
MQQSRIHTNSFSITSVQTRPEAGLFIYGTVQIQKFRHYLSYYSRSIPVIALIGKVIRTSWQIVAFLVSFLFRQSITKKPQLDRPPVRVLEQKSTLPSLDMAAHEKQLKENFLSMASHELKTPMTTIVGQVQLLMRRLSKLEKSSELTFMRTALESIDGQTRRLNGIVNELLDLQNIRFGKVELNLQPCNLVDLSREVIEEQQHLSGRPIQLDMSSLEVMLYADAYRLKQVIVNLVNNAIKYSPEESLVKVFVGQQQNIGILEVSNLGSGIPGEQQARIFEPFYRAPDVQLTSKSGIGLGLTICKDIVERHGGRIWCRSYPEKGSTFIVELPLHKNESLEK